MQISKLFEWDMGHRIPNHKSKCRYPHGHRYKVEIFLEGDILNHVGASDEGMVLDYNDIKKILIEEIDDVCDHVFMFSDQDKIMTKFYEQNPTLRHLKVSFIPTAENIAKWLFARLEKRFNLNYGKNLYLKQIKLWETPNSTAIITK